MTTSLVTMHVFEKAGLGMAPFAFIGYERKTFQACPGAPIQPGGSCDYCGTGIMDMFMIRSADGRRFKVGCDCVAKTGDAGLTAKVEDAAKKAKRDAKRHKDNARIAAAREALASNSALFTDKPHPRGWPEKTLRDYVEWMMVNAGNTGRLHCSKLIEEACR